MRSFSKHFEDGDMYRRIVLGIVLVIVVSVLANSAAITVNLDGSGNHTIAAALNDAGAYILLRSSIFREARAIGMVCFCNCHVAGC